MKYFALLVLIFWYTGVFSQDLPALIPMPNKMTVKASSFHLNHDTQINTNSFELKGLSAYLSYKILQFTDLSLIKGNNENVTSISLNLKDQRNTNAEAYILEVNDKKITLTAKTKNGIFNGLQTLLQLIRTSKLGKNGINIPALTIADQPKYSWRGFMLDESRHFFGKKKVKELIDWMAFYKLNKLHWHLTDEPAWRLEIKKYPKLGLVGGIGNYLNPLAPALYYTQSDIQEIVSYAAERFITIIPEIDMPGHATAANMAYPQYSGGGSKDHPEFTFNPGKEETYQYLTHILKETQTLFPSGMIHLGGDEVSYGNEKWATDPAITALKEQVGLNTDKAVETYFMKRMADSTYNMNAKVLVWDEMVEAGLPSDKTIIFWWRHDKPIQLKNALANHYQTVLCPRLPLYFDFVQDSTHQHGRKWNKDFNALSNVYNFNVDNLVGDNTAYVLGIQANLWTETVQNEKRFDYLLFPRISALAEVAWSNTEVKNEERYKLLLPKHLALYELEGLYYFHPFKPNFHPEPISIRKQPQNFKD